MSDKEERLVLAIIPAKERSETCPFCSTGEFWDMCSLYYKDGEADCDKCQEGILRSEVIKRMVEAMEAPYFNDIHASEPDMLEALAAAALDTLIEIYRRNLSNKAGI